MYWKYGNYTHPANEVNLVSVQQYPVYTDRLYRRTSRYRMTIAGELQYATQAELTTKITELMAAYDYDGYEAGLYQDDGTVTRHHLPLNGNLISGPRIMYRDFPKGDAAEYATKRTFRVVLEAEYLEVESQLVSFQETLSFRGTGGPLWRMKMYAKGVPKPELLAQKTPQQIIQHGTVVGLQGYPLGFLPAPLFPQWEHANQRSFNIQSPRRYGNMFLDFPMTYAYVFTLPVAQDAFPNAL